MIKRRISTFLAALVAAAMIGMREATGLAPPPPIFQDEEVHWLSPELEGDPELVVTLEDAPEVSETGATIADQTEARSGIWRRLRGLITRWGGS